MGFLGIEKSQIARSAETLARQYSSLWRALQLYRSHELEQNLTARQPLAMQDPVDASPAVLVKRYNITEQKHLEIQLTAHHDALQRSLHSNQSKSDSCQLVSQQSIRHRMLS